MSGAKRDWKPRFVRAANAAIVVWAVVASFPAAAEEPFVEFLDALRRREMYDTAMLYLESMKESPLLTDAQRETIALEEGRTLVQGANRINDFELRMEQLDEARERFTEFITEYPSHVEVGGARMQLGNVLVARGRTQLARAERPANSARKQELEEEARSLFEEARTVFLGAEKDFDEQVASFPTAIDREQTELIAARDRATTNRMQAQLLTGQVLFEMAGAEPEGSERRAELLRESADKFGEVYEKNRIVFGGLYARMWQGRCFYEMGELKQALAYFSDLLAQPDDQPKFRSLKAKTLRLAMLCWAEESQKKYDEAIARGEAWLTSARGSESVSPEGIAIRWLTAAARLARAAEPELPEADANRDREEAEAHLQVVAKYPGEYRQRAKERLAELDNREVDGEPENFAESLAAGQNLLTQLEAAKSGGGDGDIAELREEAINRFEQTLALRDAESAIDDVNQVRYYLCYLYFQAGRYYDAAVLGEFLARRYPDSGGARPAGKIAMYAYLQSYNAAPPTEREFDTSQMVGIAEFLAEQWPEEPEADDAWMKLGTVSARSGNVEDAITYFGRVREGSPQRSRADLQAGQATWSKYLRSMDRGELAADADSLAKQAAELLDRGLAAGGLDAKTLAAAELARAQIYLRDGEYEDAIGLLRDGGLLEAASQGQGAAARPEFALEVYKTALRAYVGSEQIDEAVSTLDALITLANSTAGGGAVVTRVLVQMARELESQVASLQAANQVEDRNRVLKTLSTFLDRIKEQELGKAADAAGGNSYATLLWVAETYTGIGSGLVQQGAARLEAKPYFNNAVEVYRGILARAGADPGFMPAENVTSLEVRLARCERLSEQFEAALERLVAILKRRPATIDAQVEAALVYEDWGRVRPAWYLSAIRGARKARKRDGSTTRIVWGWAKISAVVQRNADFRDVYHEARFHLADCYFKYAQSQSGDEKAKALAQADVAIRATARLFPELGGPDWANRYDALLKRIQRELGTDPVGLETAQVTTGSR